VNKGRSPPKNDLGETDNHIEWGDQKEKQREEKQKRIPKGKSARHQGHTSPSSGLSGGVPDGGTDTREGERKPRYFLGQRVQRSSRPRGRDSEQGLTPIKRKGFQEKGKRGRPGIRIILPKETNAR